VGIFFALTSLTMFKFYILYSEGADKFYIGHTGDDIEERLRKHNSNHSGFTGKYNDWRVMYQESHLRKSEAYQRESEVEAWKSSDRVRAFLKKISAGSEHLP
jgi:putative endonuclease